jgi:Mn-dependent DtxR family transcriptional regulator
MPPTVRELIARLEQAGFVDAKHYQLRAVELAIEEATK